MTSRRGPEYQPSIGRGKRLAVVAGLTLTVACQAEIQPTPATEIFPTQPQANEVVPTPSPVDRVGDKMAESSPQVEPSATPDLMNEARARLPSGVNGEVISGENGRPQLNLEIHNSNLPDGKVSIAEYENGQWNIIPFSFTRSMKEMIDIGRSGNTFFGYSEIQNIHKEGVLSVWWGGTTASMGLKLDRNQNGELTTVLLQADRNGIFKTEVDHVWFEDDYNNGYVKPVNDLNLEDVSRLVNRMDLNFQVGVNGGMTKVIISPVFLAVEKTAEISSCNRFASIYDVSSVVEQCKSDLQTGNIAKYENAQDMINAVKDYTVRPAQTYSEQDWWSDNVIPEVPQNFIFIYLVHDLDLSLLGYQ